MAENEMNAGVQIEWVQTSEKPYKPKTALTIDAVLEPADVPGATYYPPTYYEEYEKWTPPGIATFPEMPKYEAPPSELIINLETTRVKPWEGRLICIGVLDPNSPAVEPYNIIMESEEEMLDTFLGFYEDSDYKTIIGYNVSFDYRWLYALCQKYRKTAPNFMNAKLADMMQQQKQVKQEFVYGMNPTGKLDEWTEYLLGLEPYAAVADVMKWYKEKNFEEITNYNVRKLLATYSLFTMNKIVTGELAAGGGKTSATSPVKPEEIIAPVNPSMNVPEPFTVQCGRCRAEQPMPVTEKVIKCRVCGNEILNPGL